MPYSASVAPLRLEKQSSRSSKSWRCNCKSIGDAWMEQFSPAGGDSQNASATTVCTMSWENLSVSSMENDKLLPQELPILKSCLKFHSAHDHVRSGSVSIPIDTGRSTDAPTQLASALRKRVEWSQVNSASHEMILGDNPSVSVGAPVCLSWKAFENMTCSIDDYENMRPAEARRENQQMLLPESIRDDLLRKAGYSRRELSAAATEARKIREIRRKSANNLSYRVQRWLHQTVKSSKSTKKTSRSTKLEV